MLKINYKTLAAASLTKHKIVIYGYLSSFNNGCSLALELDVEVTFFVTGPTHTSAPFYKTYFQGLVGF